MLFYTLTILLLFQLTIFQSVNSSWWYLNNFKDESFTDPRILCQVLPKNKKQQKMCERRVDLIFTIGESTHRTISECQYQFRFQKWNCSVFQRDSSIFFAEPFSKHFIKGGTRELSFVQALASSSAVHSLSKACSTGYFPCECTSNSKNSESIYTQDKFKWEGCTGSGVDFSLKFVRRFIDSEEEHRRDTKTKTTLHNNRAGREMILKRSSFMCKCHGMSGSCTMRTCWRILPNLRDISNVLKQKYDEAIKINLNPSGKLIPIDPLQKKPNKWDLVYYEDSPDYCSIDHINGLMGTGDRICNETSEESDSCDILCCGRGYNSYRRSVTWRCECTFHWCCEVKCKICHEWRTETKCKSIISSSTLSTYIGRNKGTISTRFHNYYFPSYISSNVRKQMVTIQPSLYNRYYNTLLHKSISKPY